MLKKKVLITGASKGIGLAMAKHLAGEYDLLLHASKPESFTDIPEGAELLCADFSSNEQINAFCKKLKKEHGDSLYAMINNAGLTFDKSLIYQPESEIDTILTVNLKAPIMICKTVMKGFVLQKRGVIINVSSCVGESGNAFQAVYSATKAGIVGLTKSLAREVAALSTDHTIRVLSIAPGFIETDMTAILPEGEREKYLKMIPANRFGNADDIASTISFLLSDKAAFINGTNIHINGGML